MHLNTRKMLGIAKSNTKLQHHGLVAFYDICPGNAAGLFLVWHRDVRRVNRNDIRDAECDVLITQAMNLLSTGHNT